MTFADQHPDPALGYAILTIFACAFLWPVPGILASALAIRWGLLRRGEEMNFHLVLMGPFGLFAAVLWWAWARVAKL